jgi:hypothetical protein
VAAERAAHQRVAVAERFVQQHRAELDRLGPGRGAAAEWAVQSREGELHGRWHARNVHQSTRPGLWEQVRTFGGANRKSSSKDAWLATEVGNASHAPSAAQQGWDAAQREVDAARRAVDAALPRPPLQLGPLGGVRWRRRRVAGLLVFIHPVP